MKIYFLFLFFIATILSAQKNGIYQNSDGKDVYYYNGIKYSIIDSVKIGSSCPVFSTLQEHLSYYNTRIYYLDGDYVIRKSINSSEIDSFKDKEILGAWNTETGKPISYSGEMSNSGALEQYCEACLLSDDTPGKSYGTSSGNGFYIDNQTGIDRVREQFNLGKPRVLSGNEYFHNQVLIGTVKTNATRKIIFSRDLIKKAFDTKKTGDIKTAIKSIEDALYYIENKCNKYGRTDSGIIIDVREHKRKSIGEYVASDGTKFHHKKMSGWNHLKKKAYKIVRKKRKLKKSKFHNHYALVEGLKYELELLQNELEIQKNGDLVKKDVDIDQEDLHNLIDSVREGSSSESGLGRWGNIGGPEGDDRGDSGQNILDEAASGVGSEDVVFVGEGGSGGSGAESAFVDGDNLDDDSFVTPYPLDVIPQPNGFLENATTRMLKFGKRSAYRNPMITRKVATIANGVIQSVLSDPTLVPKIKNTIKETMESLKPKDLVSDFDKRNFSRVEKDSFAQVSDTYLNPDVSRKEEVQFKDFVDKKITYQRIELDDFYEECLDLDISKNENPLLYYSNEYSKETCKVVKYGLDFADECFVENRLELANDVTDLSASLLKVSKDRFKFFKLVGQGILQGVDKYKNPLKVVKDFGTGFVDLAVGLGKVALKLRKFGNTCLSDPILAFDQMQKGYKIAGNRFVAIKNSFSKLSYEERVILVSKVVTEFAVDGILTWGTLKAGSTAGKFFKALPGLVKKEAVVTRLATRAFNGSLGNLKKVVAPLSNAVMETSEFIEIAARNGKDSVLRILDFMKGQPAISLSADSVGVVVHRGSNSFKDFAKYRKAVNSFGGKCKKSVSLKSIKGMIKEKRLHTKGRIRFVPSKGDKEVRMLTRLQCGSDYGFKDKFNNIWIKGRKSKTALHPEGFEWDVQLSKKGKSMLGWASKSGNHLNVSPIGHITH